MKKIVPLSIFIFLFYLTCYSQSWVGVGTGVDNEVDVLDSSNGYLYAGGTFKTAGGVSANYIAAWDGNTWSALGNGTDNKVIALTEYNGNLVAGGSFTSAGGITVNHIAMWDGKSWSALGNGFNGPVTALIVYQGNLYAGGSFTVSGSDSVNNIAMWNGSSWSALGKGLNAGVGAFTIFNGKLIVGGYFQRADSINDTLVAEWNGVAWQHIHTVSFAGYDPCAPGNMVTCLTVYNNNLYVGGFFGIQNNNQYTLAKFNDTALVNTLDAFGAANELQVLVTYKNVLIAGGPPGYIGGDLSYWNDTSWNTMGAGIYGCDNASCNVCGGMVPPVTVYAAAGYKGNVYAGGIFLASQGNNASYLEQYNGPLSINVPVNYHQVNIFPNPGDGIFNFSLQGFTRKVSIKIMNMLGEEIYSSSAKTPPRGIIKVNLKNAPAGIYFYKVTDTSNHTYKTGKLIIQ